MDMIEETKINFYDPNRYVGGDLDDEKDEDGQILEGKIDP